MDFENMLIDWKTFLVSNDNWHLMRDTSSVIWQLWSFFDKMTKTCRVLWKNSLTWGSSQRALKEEKQNCVRQHFTKSSNSCPSKLPQNVESVTTAAVHEVFLWIVRRHTGDCGRWSGDWRLRRRQMQTRPPPPIEILSPQHCHCLKLWFLEFSFSFI